jgi:hypothetical protein
VAPCAPAAPLVPLVPAVPCAPAVVIVVFVLFGGIVKIVLVVGLLIRGFHLVRFLIPLAIVLYLYYNYTIILYTHNIINII